MLALECIQALCQLGFNVTNEEIEKGFLETRWEGRFTVLSRNPYFIVDGAHNVDAAMKLRQSIMTYFPQKRLIFIMGMFRDKRLPAGRRTDGENGRLHIYGHAS